MSSATATPLADGPAAPRIGHARMDWRLGAQALLIVAAQRILLVAMGVWHGPHPLYKWDGIWYRRIATEGYTYPTMSLGAHPRVVPSSLAFFPLLPVGGRWLHDLTGLSISAAIEIVALLGLPAAVLGIAAVGCQVADRRTALLLVALWGAAPRGLVTLMPYTEGIFTALCAWALWAMLRRHWWRAALLCAMAGLVRSSVITLVATLGIAWLWHRRHELARVRTLAQGLGLALLSLSGLLAYVGYVAHRTGRWDGYVRVQAAWHMEMGSPLHALRQIPWIWHIHHDWWGFNYTVIPSVIALALMLGILALRPPLPLWSFTTISTIWTWCAQNYFWSKPRFLLPVFPLGLAPARLLARMPLWLAVVIVVALTAESCWADVQLWSGFNSP